MGNIIGILVAFVLLGFIFRAPSPFEPCSPFWNNGDISQASALRHLSKAEEITAKINLTPQSSDWRANRMRLRDSQRCMRLAVKEWPPLMTQKLTMSLLRKQSNLFEKIRRQRASADYVRGIKYNSELKQHGWLFWSSVLISVFTFGSFLFWFVYWAIRAIKRRRE
ncbi:hypothetical protein RU820_04990 [Acidithiobacillus ferrooxidans]|nr:MULTISPECIES: hypothetical protein [Acidithiobacillus]MBN6744213.1 hypothetical protein [Acidithiobacillus sp. MC2.2]MBN6746924.1 hypothetical protein [Acidithiobacillus sp. PG05]